MPQAISLTKIQTNIGYFTLLVYAILYFTSSKGINCSNDGSHFALAKSIYYNHKTEITPFFGYVKDTDYAVKDGIIYSDRLPGNAFLMLPFIAYSNFFEFVSKSSFGNKFEADIIAVLFLPNICGILGLVLMFLLYLKIGFGFNLAYLSTIIYGVSTLHWFESVHAFSHAPSMLFVMMAVYLAIISIKDINRDKRYLYVVAALIGFSTLIELQNILFFFPIFLYIFVSAKVDFREFRSWVPILSGCVALLTFFVGCLVYYNYITFGELLLKSNTYNPHFPEEKSFSSALSGNSILGLDKLLTNFSNINLYVNWQKGVGNDIPGLLVSSPILLLSIWGFVPFLKREKNMALLFLLMIGISIAIAAFHKTTLTRHIFTINPFFYFPIIYSFRYIWRAKKFRIMGLGLVALLVLISTFRIAYVIHTYYGRGSRGIFGFQSEIVSFVVFYTSLAALFLILTGIQKKLKKV
ncbi:uncharacterized protein DUF2723 [Dyadobacter jejuensis]|uniref:Uncharacterized protein DUF2723 n=1 Tax=Dyadobacter jejuensis TaxID=1082580 RepID=A0A316ARN0_9BACT|nr:DUF2723 domain-containing protein [Dyadobacter jejuensis]PWJ60026.1 uncharacterized protein DUF2723 [Dyadobacter jejuensis]